MIDCRGERASGDANLNEARAAGVTAVGFLSRVDARVSLQVRWTVELSTAHVTAVRLVTCESNGHCYTLVLGE